MKFIHLLIVAYAVFTLTSCVKDANIVLPDVEDVLVVNGVIHPDSNVTINVTASQKIGVTNEIKGISDAKVSLYERDKSIGILDASSDGTFYSTDYSPSEGEKYTVVVEKEGYKTVESETVLPTVGGSIENVTYLGPAGKNNSQLQVTINDIDPSSNYYQLLIYRVDTVWINDEPKSYERGNEVDYYSVSGTDIEETLYKDNRLGYFSYYNDEVGLVFSDDNFNQAQTNLNILSRAPDFFQSIPGGGKATVDYRFVLRNINKDYYEYRKSIAIREDSDKNPLAEPSLIYNNIKDGLGNFSAYQENIPFKTRIELTN